MRALRQSILVLVCLAAQQCSSGEAPTPQPDPTPGTAGEASAERTPTGYVRVARIEGYGNPRTGELWARATPLDGAEAPEGVGVNENAVALGAPGYCEVTVESDGNRNANPLGTFEFYTEGEATTGDTSDDASFDIGTCYGRLPGHLQDGSHSDAFSGGVGCAYMHIGNFSGNNYDSVLLDIDVFNGDVGNHGPFGFGYTEGTADTPEGVRNAPQADLGLWDFGAMNHGEWTNMWIFFKNRDAVDFNWTGYVLAAVYEDCGNGMDEDCDGIADNNCLDVVDGDGCYTDSDCASFTCQGELLLSGLGGGGGDLTDDVQGICRPNHCENLIPDVDETGLDCGGSCNACGAGSACLTMGDCAALDCSSAGLCYESATCGDGVMDPGEECDDGLGNDNNGDCKLDCTVGDCGDGFVNCQSEACDGEDCLLDCTARTTGVAFTFQGGFDGDNVTDCRNWYPNGVPGSPDLALFDSGGPSAIIDAPLSVDTLALDGGFSGTVVIDADVTIGSVIDVSGGTLLLSDGVPTDWTIPGLSMSGGAVVDLGFSTMEIHGDATFTSSLAANTATVTLSPGSGDVYFSGASFGKLVLAGSNGGDVATLHGSGTVNGMLTLGSGDPGEDMTWNGWMFSTYLTTNGPIVSNAAGQVSLGPDITVDSYADVNLNTGGRLDIYSALNFYGTGQLVSVNINTYHYSSAYISDSITLAGDTYLGPLTVDGTLTAGPYDLVVPQLDMFGGLIQTTGRVATTDMTVYGIYVGDSGDLDVLGSLYASGATSFQAPADLQVGGDVELPSTNFDANGGLINLSGSSGSRNVDFSGNVLNDLSLTDKSGSYYFRDGDYFTVAGTFLAHGNSGTSLSLVSQFPGTQWGFNANTPDFDYVYVEDSDNTGPPIVPPNWEDGGNNMGWGSPPPMHGYFVMSSDIPSASFGGRMNADALCLSELTSKEWNGREDAMMRGLLTPMGVKAWLCDGTGCMNPPPGREFRFASVQNKAAGGASFTSSPTGTGPGNASQWELLDHFGDMGTGTDATVWTGRGAGTALEWSELPSSLHCGGWSSTLGDGRVGVISGGKGGSARWSFGDQACNTSDGSIICTVIPGMVMPK